MHTITIERHTGILSIVERYDGDVVKVCADITEVDVANFAAVARQYARSYGAQYIPPGQ